MTLVSAASATDPVQGRGDAAERLSATPWRLSPLMASALPLAFTAGLVAIGLLGTIRQHAPARWSILGAAGLLLVWTLVLTGSARATGRTFGLAVLARKQHYLQACAQLTVLLYWGWHWRDVYEAAPLIASQLLFAYAFDVLLGWSVGNTCVLGFGPFPVIFSINLFLWFRPDWFYLQLLMVALGFAAKELLRWEKQGRRAHIFNPSSFPLAVFSLALILTGTSDLTRGQDIAITQFFPPHMYLLLFLVSLPGQFLFGVAAMTLSAVLSTYLFGLLYFGLTGVYFFYDSYVPIAVFLGMHLLFTDPSTSPSTELGRIIFGVLYGLSAVALYQALGALGLPTFYDKLLQVPILNLSIKLIDRAARSSVLSPLDPTALGRTLAPRQRHVAYMTIWAAVFAGLSLVQGVGDRHRGQWVPFWQEACLEGRPHACAYLTNLQSILCRAGSGWACNEAGILFARDGKDTLDRTSPQRAVAPLERGCDLGFAPACRNGRRLAAGDRQLEHGDPTLEDYPILLRGSKGPIRDRRPDALYTRACSQGWPGTCARIPRAGD